MPAGVPEWLQLVIFYGAVLAVFYMFLIHPQIKRQKERRQFMSSLKRGDMVATVGGICGRITDINENLDLVTLQVADGVELKILRSGIERRLDKDEAAKLKWTTHRGKGKG